jgi:hypothetical protein
MVDRAAGTFYLALSLAAAAHPVAATAQALPAASATSHDEAPKVAPSAGERNGFAVVDIPVRNRSTDSKTVASVIAEEARRVTTSPDDPSGESYFAANATLGTTDLNQGVVAEHDKRIAMLKERIASVKAQQGPDAAKQLDDLNTRLKRAEAARSLALARATLEPKCASDCDANGALAERDAESPETGDASAAPKPDNARSSKKRSTDKAAPAIPTSAMPGPGQSRVALKSAPAEPFHSYRVSAMSNSAPRSPATFGGTPKASRVLRIQTGSQLMLRPGNIVSVAAAAGRCLVVRTIADRAMAERLRRSRDALAMARRALGASPRSPHAAAQIAGIWLFDGSDSWSLSGYARRIA